MGLLLGQHSVLREAERTQEGVHTSNETVPSLFWEGT